MPPEYYFENGLRKVRPYVYQHETFAKARWLGRTLEQVFRTEFTTKPFHYYENSILNGTIKVNTENTVKFYVFKNADILQSLIHQHERVVTAQPIQIVHESPNLLVVNKPGSMPVHPTARYNFNSLTQILKYEYGYEDLHCINRLDRLTSGIVMLSKNKETAASMMKLLKSKSIKKSYFARVKGRFPYDRFVCTEAIAPQIHKAGKIGVTANGKECTTVFSFCSFNGITSLLKCEPLTGRTHQIRVHLQHLGYPIANDPLYGCLEWEPEHKNWIADRDDYTAMPPDSIAINDTGDTIHCFECAYPTEDPIPEQLSIWLHAYEYQSDNWTYCTERPKWAEFDWAGDVDISERFWDNGGLWDGIPPKVYSNKPPMSSPNPLFQ